MEYVIDFETRSSKPISAGIMNYLNGRNADIVCMGWKVVGDTHPGIWIPGKPFPFEIRPEDKIHAFNVMFDYNVWDILGEKYHLPLAPLDQWRDVMALCGRYTLPQNLQQASETLGVPVTKDRRGKALIKKICVPPFVFGKDYTKQDLHDFYVYCMRDVESTYQVMNALPTTELSPYEQSVWLATMNINIRGVPVDTWAVKRIFHVMNSYIEEQTRQLPLITNGAVNTHNQVKAIVQWAHSQGVELPDLTKATVEKWVNKLDDFLQTGDMTPEDPPFKVLKVLQLRQALALTSTAKYKKLMELNYEGRIYENLRYHGAATGRWAGMGAQLHNLPRASVSDPEKEIQEFYKNKPVLEIDPLASAKALVRSMICAPPNHKLCVADYSSIENRILMWVCEEWEAIDLINQGRDQYIDMAASLYMKGYNDVTKSERALGKTLILGAGYNLGGRGFKAYASGFGIDLSEEGAEQAIQQYRKKYQRVVKYWYAAKETMVHAIQNPMNAVRYGKCIYQLAKDKTGRQWLVLTLPSGRSLFYCEPKLKQDKYGLIPTHKGINSYTRKWERMKIIPGRIIENIVQATARDILADAKLRMEKVGFKTVLSVHDEIVVEAEESKADHTLHDMIGIMGAPPLWAEGMPLGAEGFVTKRYKKG